MEGRTTLNIAKSIFGNNFIGLQELKPFLLQLGFSLNEINQFTIPQINYSEYELQEYSNDFLLVLGIPKIFNIEISIRFMREKLGIDPLIYEPCFYNQDWYINEPFIDDILEFKWYLIKKKVEDNSRALQPSELIRKGYIFPSAILCAYTFFANYFYNKTFLWENEYIWCSDTDHNSDIIYVGRYRDPDGVNKNGFSIHRHLTLKSNYASLIFIPK